MSSSHASSGPATQAATSEERDELLEEATEAVLSCPVLFDVAESLPEWEMRFGALAMDISCFLRSPEFEARASKRGAVGSILEVRHNAFVRLPLAKDCSTERLATALEATDGRAVSAIVLARLLREGRAAPSSLLKDQISKAFTGAFKEGESERFLLTAVAALPRGALDVTKEAIEIIASGYMRLERPPAALLNMAFNPAYEGVPWLRSALKQLGLQYGVKEWIDLSRPQPSKASLDANTQHKQAASEEAERQEALEKAESQTSTTKEQPAVNREAVREAAAAEDDAENEEVCRRIAAMKKVDYDDVDLEKRSWIKEPEDPGVRSLQRTVQGAVKRLSEDLYSGEAHFLLELLQNCDDCTYPEGEIPTLRLTYESRRGNFDSITSFRAGDAVEAYLVLEHNESGFQEKNVTAICDIDKSTKQLADKKFIGAKGIGFKSVFLVTSTPVLHSRGFHFHFDADALQGLGSLLPFPLPPPSNPPRGTRLVLPLSSTQGPLTKRGLQAPDIGQRALKDVQPTLLLFLRKLAQVEVMDEARGLKQVITKEILPSEGQAKEIKLKVDITSPEASPESEEQRWLVQTRGVQVDSLVTELKLAFRLDSAAGSSEKVYAWLPLQSYGLRFIVQADWKVPSSREAITDNVFNQRIREQVPAAFVEAAETFRNLASAAALEHDIVLQSCEDWEDEGDAGVPGSQMTAALDASAETLLPFYAAIPRSGDTVNFFQGTDVSILNALREVPLILVRKPCPGHSIEPGNGDAEEDGQEVQETQEPHFRLAFSTASHAVREQLPEGVPANLSEHLSTLEPLLAEAGHYLEVGKLPARVADALGVTALDADVALDCLKAFARRWSQREETFALQVSDIETLHLLLLILEAKEELYQEIKQWAVVPSEAGLVALAEQEAQGRKVYDIPDEMAGLEAVLGEGQRLDPRLSRIAQPKVKQLFKKLGIERVDGWVFFENVLLPVLSGGEAPDADKLVAVTARFKHLLAICEDSDLKDKMVACVSETGWWVLASTHTGEMQTAKVGGQSGKGLHLTPLSKSLASRLADEAHDLEWLTPSDAYCAEETSADSDSSQQWEDFWTLLGAVPAFHIKRGDDITSKELERLLQIAGSDANLAKEVVELLAPHGDFYADSLWISGSQEADAAQKQPSSVGRMLCMRAWLPTHRGLSVPMHMAWLCPDAPKPSEQRFTFDPCVSTLAEEWPGLGIEKDPSAQTIISILRDLRSRKGDLKIATGEMKTIYSKLQAKPARNTETCLAACVDQEDLEMFISEEKWVYIPNHPKPHGTFKEWYDRDARQPHRGDFYSLSQLVFSDRAECLDGFSSNARDDAIDLMRGCLGKRVVANYYFGQQTLWPASWKRSVRSEFLDFLASRGVQARLEVDDYITVLKAVDEQLSVITAKKGTPKIKETHIPGFVRQILRTVSLVVDTEIKDAQHRQEEEEDGGAATDMEMSSALATFYAGALDLCFLKAADESWQPMRQFAYIIDQNKLSQLSGWLPDARRFVAIVPIVPGQRDASHKNRHSIMQLLKRCGIRPWDQKEETLRRCAVVIPEAVHKEKRQALAKEILSQALHKIADKAQDMPVKESGPDIGDVFRRMKDVAERLRVEPASRISFYQVIALDVHEVEASGKEIASTEDMSMQFVEFKSSKSAAVPIVRIKELERIHREFTGESAESGDEEKQLVFAFEGGVVEAIQNGSRELARALVTFAMQGLPEKQQEPKGKQGLSEQAAAIVNLLRMAIGTVAQGQSEPSESLPDLPERPPEPISMGGDDPNASEMRSPTTVATEAESKLEEDSESREQLLEKLFEEMKDMDDSDWWGALAQASDAEDVQQEGSGVEPDFSVSDLLRNAGEALDFRRRRRSKATSREPGRKSGSSSVPAVQAEAAGRDQELAELLPPMVPYNVAESSVPYDAQPGGPRPEGRGQGSRQAMVDAADASGQPARKDGGRAPARGEQDEDQRDLRPRRILQREKRQLSHPRGYPLERIALDLDTPPMETGSFQDLDVRLGDLQDALGKASAPSASSMQRSPVGQIGEQLAALSLEQQGFQVCWINEASELGLPCDLILSQGGTMPTICGGSGSVEAELVKGLLDAALRGEGDPNIVFAEVKSTTSGDREFFEISRAEVEALSTLGPRYWIVRVFGVPRLDAASEPGVAKATKVRLWKDPNRALGRGEMKLLLLT
ncbi:NOV [Symbiodinium natans]|nr:NOV [Symbiodinium natans]